MLACLKMAKAAGINVHGGELVEDITGRDVLLLQRFDISESHRRHLISINGLRKDAYQRDDAGVFRYDDVHKLLQSHSVDFREDAEQLLRQMLFNRAINNTGDHERNFSMINDGSGYRLSPAYDLVPSLTTGAYHIAGYQFSPYPPKPSEIIKQGKVFGLDKTTVKNIAEQIMDAIQQWENFAAECKVGDSDYSAIKGLLSI
ncbi:MAG: HipA domain-containing protein [Zhongshania sp.]|uniref:type II toxin-antitoxin system HipA family toxin n=1 Tax=Zhongshania sp. TaxID=1971902 RepID=UPI0026028236|nr:HipA domain-containing protein [Zhongshania sp.]MDF1692070.1 HipA domain-containing protein [Zhongshania sp.]